MDGANGNGWDENVVALSSHRVWLGHAVGGTALTQLHFNIQSTEYLSYLKEAAQHPTVSV